MTRVYFDQAATTYPKPPEVMEAMINALTSAGGNPGRSGHALSVAASRVVFETRELIADLIGARDSSHIAFTLNATDALNMAIKGLLPEVSRTRAAAPHVVTTSMEHNSVIRPLTSLANSGAIRLTMVHGDSRGFVPVDRLIGAIEPETALVVMTHASNVTGSVMDIAAVSSYTRSRDTLLLVDAAQSAGILPIDVERLGIDLLAASGHKALLGPQGTGFLYCNPNRCTLRPFREGGTGSFSDLDEQPASLPDRWEAGTPNTPGIAGLGAAVKQVMAKGLDAIRHHEASLLKRLRESLLNVSGLTLYGPEDASMSTGVLSINLNSWDPAELAFWLEQRAGIITRPGLHCAPHAHRTIGTFPTGTVRLSVSSANTADEADYVAEQIRLAADSHDTGRPANH